MHDVSRLDQTDFKNGKQKASEIVEHKTQSTGGFKRLAVVRGEHSIQHLFLIKIRAVNRLHFKI